MFSRWKYSSNLWNLLATPKNRKGSDSPPGDATGGKWWGLKFNRCFYHFSPPISLVLVICLDDAGCFFRDPRVVFSKNVGERIGSNPNPPFLLISVDEELRFLQIITVHLWKYKMSRENWTANVKEAVSKFSRKVGNHWKRSKFFTNGGTTRKKNLTFSPWDSQQFR